VGATAGCARSAPARPDVPAARVRAGSVYLLAGTGGRAPLLAEALARTSGVRLALVDAPGAADALAARLAEAGAEVAVFPADLADAAALAGAAEAVEARWGAVDGVLLSPALGALGEPAAIGEARAEWSAALAAYLAGLEAAAAALGARGEFRLVESSLAGVLGSAGLVRAAAAHALTDTWAAARGWTAVDWDRAAAGADDPAGIPPDAVPAALDAVLALADQPQVLVSPVSLEARLRAATAAEETAAAGVPLHARPVLEVEYHAPTSEVEERLARLWESLLGIERIGVHDDFFGLGGHSLLATQIVARVREIFALDLPLASIFEAPTIARYAALIEDAVIAELEGLSEEEAVAMAGG
jgi:hypothetical protein